MSSSSKPNRVTFKFSFLDKKYEPFLKQGSNLSATFWGQPLNELISLNSNDFTGIKFEKTTIPTLTKYVYDNILKKKNDLIIRKNREITFFVYTLCKLGDIVVFLVSEFWTEISYEDKEFWEDFYGFEYNACCKQHYSHLIQNSSDPLVVDSCELNNADLDLIIEKNCIFKKPYIKCNSVVFSHFFNNHDEKIVKKFKDTMFNIPIQFTYLSDYPYRIQFLYGGVENLSSVTCDLLYDKIGFENINGEIQEYNVKNFISDSLHTCFNFQKNIQYCPYSFVENDQRLLYLSISL